jgi:hypothetical protein
MEKTIPAWLSLFYSNWKELKSNENDIISDSFIEIMDILLHKDFFQKTGIKKLNNALAICYWWQKNGINVYTQYDFSNGISSLTTIISTRLGELPESIKICWKAKSGKEIEPSQLNIDIKDIEMWFEGLNVQEVREYYYGEKTAWYKLAYIRKLSYILDIKKKFGTDIIIQLYIKEKNIDAIHYLVQNLYGKLENWNTKSEAKDRLYGVVHNYHSSIIKDDFAELIIDFGSAEDRLMKDILKMLSKTNLLSKVIIA